MTRLKPKSFKKYFKKLKPLKRFWLGIGVLVTLLLVLLLAYNLYFFGRIFPNTYVAGINVSSLPPQEASLLLEGTVKTPEKIILIDGGEPSEISTQEINLSYDFSASAMAAFERTRTGNILYDFTKRTEALFGKTNLGLRLTLDEEKLEEILSVIAGEITEEPVYPAVSLAGKEVLVEKGKAGTDLDLKALRAQIGEALSLASSEPISIPLKKIDPTLTEEEAAAFGLRAEKLIDKTLTLKFEFQTFTYKGNDLLSLLDAKKEFNKEELDKLIGEIAKEVNRDPQDSVFIFEEGLVKEFAPSKDGITLNSEELIGSITENLRTLETTEEKQLSIDIPVARNAPKIQTEDVNNLGIKELIGRGSSRFAHSIANRIYNISLASSRIKGVLVAPGEVFSFNDALGDVSLFTGYREAYIIKDGKTILGDGGGVCQVSTTLFRAALNAGLPIVERRAHAYRVAYYEQDSPPGFDATVYAPTTDLKFKNDTPGHILIQSAVDTKRATLVFEIYGTSDGRVAKTSKPIVTDVVPPPEDLYQDDPTLPAGTIKQVDFKAWGAKVIFNYTVERGG
ncbi:MAG: VanW family protein, partial [Patescibacteria group bacterium]